jgi:hypothetical protein
MSGVTGKAHISKFSAAIRNKLTKANRNASDLRDRPVGHGAFLMGILIAMPRGKRGKSRDGASPDGAKIMLFTGIRYERHEDKPPETRKGAGRSRQRRRRA